MGGRVSRLRAAQGAAITERVSRSGTGETLKVTQTATATSSRYRCAKGLDPEFIKEM